MPCQKKRMRSSAPVSSELRACAALVWLAGVLLSPSARAEAGSSEPFARPLPRSLHAFAALSLGRGLRFNNPYRLATPLGETAESVSLSATYVDLGLAALLPAAPGWEHGPALDVLVALDGIGQLGITPSYLLRFQAARQLGLHGRLGVPLVVAPDASLGLEAALGPHVPISHGLGLTAELVGSVFFGAATEQKGVTTIPMLALQLGLCFDHRVAF
jgi:hypothetical protein